MPALRRGRWGCCCCGGIGGGGPCDGADDEPALTVGWVAVPVPPPAWAGVLAEAAMAAAVATAGGGREVRGVEEEKCDSMHAATWASRADSLPSGPLGGRAEWQIGHSSSSGMGGAGVGGGGGTGVSMSSMER